MNGTNPFWLSGAAAQSFRWLASVYKKLLIIVPAYTTATVAASLVSLVASLIAFFLPLKIIMLLGRKGVPKFFPASWAQYERDELAIILAGGAVVFYLVFLVANRLAELWSERGAAELLSRSSKLMIFANQDALAQDTHKRLSSILAGGVYAAVGLGGLAYLYPLVAVANVALVCAALVVVAALGLHPFMRQQFAGHVKGTVDITSTVIFLAIVAIIIADLLQSESASIFRIIIAMLLFRQVNQRLATGLMDVTRLVDKKAQINALFFHGQRWESPALKVDDGFWGLIDTSRRQVWLQNVLDEITEVPTTLIESRWHQVGKRGVVGLAVDAAVETDATSERYFVKLYGDRQRLAARQEFLLLAQPEAEALPAPRLISATEIQGYTCLVYGAISEAKAPKNAAKRIGRAFLVRSWQVEPPGKILDRFRRSKPLLPDRFRTIQVSRLAAAARTLEEQAVVQRLADQGAEIEAVLEALPLFVLNLDVSDHTIRIDDDERPSAIHWGSWTLEPIGAGWPVKPALLKLLPKALANAAERRPVLADLNPYHVRMAALAFEFEQHYGADRYSTAIELLQDIFACLDGHELAAEAEAPARKRQGGRKGAKRGKAAKAAKAGRAGKGGQRDRGNRGGERRKQAAYGGGAATEADAAAEARRARRRARRAARKAREAEAASDTAEITDIQEARG